ncbi:MAG: UDP-N-acetylglucosamine 2-epimerase (non-hydrolyzing) [Candidatus Omnitrophica bacterium]|nr:UDP-N-acetylglucosamine 2-epimerase (non-hydrolyzing) [Candidatus Omnitrophota bacterium]
MKKIMVVAGARPNFMKIAPLMREFRKVRRQVEVLLVHTGQHYDYQMSEVFFKDLDIPTPDIYLEVGSGSHAVQTAKIMLEFEKVALAHKPDCVIVVGDVNSTVACSLVATKLNIRMAHVEAGLRSFDRRMPEEINRLVTDAISDYLFVSETSGMKNLKKEGVPAKKYFYVGNVMIDTLLAHLPKINRSRILSALNLQPRGYCVLTLHRPSNVDSKEALEQIAGILRQIPAQVKLVWPIHPRTKGKISEHKLDAVFQSLENLILVEPQGYVDFVRLVKDARFVLTDSGGIQEETTFLKVPCLTMRENTERPVTITEGTNILVGRDLKKISRSMRAILQGKVKQGKTPKFWDGKAAVRIVKILLQELTAGK